MGAFLVSESHVDYLVAAAIAYDMVDRVHMIQSASKVGQMLWAENAKSVNRRYSSGMQEAPEYRFSMSAFRKVDAVQVLKAINCLEYQSCEHEGWEESKAHKFLTGLRDAAISHLPGYESAAWEFNG